MKDFLEQLGGETSHEEYEGLFKSDLEGETSPILAAAVSPAYVEHFRCNQSIAVQDVITAILL
ncbi:hypothetical protein V1498_17245 [Peribacillus sp. SCS-26]|uniref:hypothetical protein n=1 Tax=Paraperibacillus marinus TaxID=3115295 RepID=UPI00390579DB